MTHDDDIQVFLLTRPSLAEQNEAVLACLAQLDSEFPHQVTCIDIDRNSYLKRQFGEQIPRLEIGPYFLTESFEIEDIRTALQETQEKIKDARAEGSKWAPRQYAQARGFSGRDRFSLWFARHYLLLFNLLVFVYLGGAFLAPTFMKLGLEPAARVIYSIYRPVCHQLAYRSFFLFGEQPFYPRELAGMEAYQTFTLASGIDELDSRAAGGFVGNDAVGYKVALCQRDVAIYFFILIFGLIFGASRRKIKEAPWYLWVVLGIIPIALDGGTQLISQMGLAFLSWFPARESTPFLRVLTGGLFGLFTAWLAYPLMESGVQDGRARLEKLHAQNSGAVFQPEERH
ncbi:MAG: DUF2085 domain-containing protein [Anaerolineaceae bacterium]